MNVVRSTICEKLVGYVRISAESVSLAVLFFLAQRTYADNWIKRDPTLLGDAVSWSSVSLNEGGRTIAGCSYIYDPLTQQYEGSFIYISEDGGETWTLRDPAGGAGEKFLRSTAMDATGSKLVACADDDYVYTSADGGKTWAKREPAGSGVTKSWRQVSISSDGSRLAACTDDNGLIFMSSDGGTTWATCDSAGSAKWSQVAWSADGSKAAAANDSAIFTSADGGSTWTKREPAGAGAVRYWTSIASSSDGATLLACEATSQDGDAKGNLWTSIDGGATWTKREPAGTGVEKTWRQVSISSDAVMMIACADEDFLYLSYDGGASWAKPDPVGKDTGSAWQSVAMGGDGLFVTACGSLGNLYTRSLAFKIADPFFTTQYLLPQTLNKENLSSFLAMEHKEYHLDGWFFFGNLIEGKGTPTKDNISTFFISLQRKDIMQIPGTPIRLAVFPSLVGFQGSRHDGYIFGGALDDTSQITVNSDPWSVVVVADGYSSMMSMCLAKGQMGMKGAVYHLASDVEDQEGHRLQTDVWIKDTFGIINDGYGPASFFPQWILPEQREKILSTYGGSLESYMFAENDPMVGQGDYYYSATSLKILSFKITRDYTELLAEGKRGKMWMDYTVASYDDRASDMINGCHWQFFAIQLSNGDSILILNTETKTTGALPVARLYRKKNKSLNGAINATYSWDIDKITITPDENSKWESPKSKITYYTKYNIELLSGNKKMNANLAVTMLRQDSEILIQGENPCYEGAGTVTGTLGSKKVKGYAFAEFEIDTALKARK